MRETASRLALRRCLYCATALIVGCSLSAPSLSDYAKARPTNIGGNANGASGSGGDLGGVAGTSVVSAGTANGGTGAEAGGATGGGGSNGVAGAGAAGGEAGEAGAANGSVGIALDFQGSQTMVTQPSVTDDFTIELWLKTYSFGTGSNYYAGETLLNADAFDIRNDFGTALLADRFAFGTGNPDTTIVSTSSVNAGVWTHVAATRVKSSGTINVYVNGMLEASKATGNTSSLTDAVAPRIGGILADDANSVGQGFIGTMSDLRIWNVAHSQAEITALMRTRLRGNEPGLVGYWRLDDGSGTVAKDSTVSHNDASLGAGYPVFAPSWVMDAPKLTEAAQ